MKNLITRTLLAGCTLLLAVSAVPAVVFAHNGEDHGSTHESVHDASDDDSSNKEDRQRRQATESKVSDDSANRNKASRNVTNRSQRLARAKLKACQAREKNIASIMTRSIARAQNQIKLFDTITERVQALYVKKGATLVNYGELVAAVVTAQSQANTNLQALKAKTFSCTAEDPKGDAAAFKAASAALSRSLKEYRTAVKNLIAGVKSVQGSKQ